jgi:hypothetical protein
MNRLFSRPARPPAATAAPDPDGAGALAEASITLVYALSVEPVNLLPLSRRIHARYV